MKFTLEGKNPSDVTPNEAVRNVWAERSFETT